MNNFNSKYCPVCNTYSKSFLPFGDNPRPQALCPNCGSLERHRLVYLYFKNRTPIFSKEVKFLHFAPEGVFKNIFSNCENIDYHPADLFPRSSDEKIDMQNIPYENDTFDFIYNSHVLEHVPDDIKAIQELYRVIKPGGKVIIMVPIMCDKTLEKDEYNTPELRSKYYGQFDHLRAYGKDFIGRLKSVGFEVEIVTTTNLVKEEKISKYGISRDQIFICTKSGKKTLKQVNIDFVDENITEEKAKGKRIVGKNGEKMLEAPEKFENHILEEVDGKLEISEMIKVERQFLNGIIRKIKPKKILEVGVAAGGSSVVILNAIKDLPEAKLYSIDYNEKYYRNNSLNTGFLVSEIMPQLKSKWKLFTGGVSAKFIEEIGRGIDLCLLDTVHSMPGEILDILMILPFMKKNGVIIIHDTNYHYYNPMGISCGVLFSILKGKKIQPTSGEGWAHDKPFANIGAVQLDDTSFENVDDIFFGLSLNWKYIPTEEDINISRNLFKKYYSKENMDKFERIYYFNKNNLLLEKSKTKQLEETLKKTREEVEQKQMKLEEYESYVNQLEKVKKMQDLLKYKEKTTEKQVNDLNNKISDLTAIIYELKYLNHSKKSLSSRFPSIHILLKSKNQNFKDKLINIKGYRAIKKNNLLDIGYYLKNNPDVRLSGMDPILHYVYHGYNEGRKPNPNFNADFYLKNYPDVKDSNLNPLVHYSLYGKKEKRKINP